MSELSGSTDFFFIWDEVYGWIHISETEKLEEARERFILSTKRRGGN